MKRSIIIAAALVSLCACTKNEVAQPENQKEVSFQVANYLSQTKAGTVAYEGTTFGAYAWYDSEAADGENQSFMVNQTIEKVTSGDEAQTASSTEWKPAGKTYYWPKTGDVDFFAYAPVAATPWIACDDVNHKLIAPRTVIAGSEDYLYSSMAMNYNANPSAKYGYYNVQAGVPILFHHALAKLTVNFATTELEKNGNIWDVTVNTAEFVKVCNAGTLAMDMNTVADGLVEWTLPENAIWTASDAAGDSATLVAADGFKLTKTFAADKVSDLTVLPQALAGMVFHINYTIKASNDGGATWYSNETVDREYPVTTAFEGAGAFWKMNTRITYNVTIAPNTSDEVLFDPAVAPWDEAEASYEFEN